MEMRKSRVLEILKKGGVARCIKLNLFDPKIVEIAGMCGFDSVWLDMEHVPTDWDTLENGVRAGKIYNTDVMVRVEKGSYSDYIKPLELDAAGIIVPHLMSLEEARHIVQTTRFHPLGKRPIDGGNADGAYCQIDLLDYAKQANENRIVCVQIEDVEPLPELEEIAQLDGIDMILFGPGDFSQSLGKPGEWENPELLKTRERVAEVCRKYGKYPATVGGPGNYSTLVNMGYQFINIGADVVGLSEYFKSLLETCPL